MYIKSHSHSLFKKDFKFPKEYKIETVCVLLLPFSSPEVTITLFIQWILWGPSVAMVYTNFLILSIFPLSFYLRPEFFSLKWFPQATYSMIGGAPTGVNAAVATWVSPLPEASAQPQIANVLWGIQPILCGLFWFSHLL